MHTQLTTQYNTIRTHRHSWTTRGFLWHNMQLLLKRSIISIRFSLLINTDGAEPLAKSKEHIQSIDRTWNTVNFRLLVPLQKNRDPTDQSNLPFSVTLWYSLHWLVSLDFCFSAIGQATWNRLYTEQLTYVAATNTRSGHYEKWLPHRSMQWVGAMESVHLYKVKHRQHSEMGTFEALPSLVAGPVSLLLDNCTAVPFFPFSMSTKEPLSTEDSTVDTQYLASYSM